MYSVPLIFVLIATAATGYNADCPSHLSTTQLFSHGNDCIQLVTNHHHSWKLARHDCQRQGGDLVEIQNAETQEFLHHIIRLTGHHERNGFWIGATDSDQEGIWKWVSGDQVSDYSHWASGEGPSHHGGGFLFSHSNTAEDCAVIRPTINFAWHDYSCSSLHSYICQYSKTQTTISPLSETQVPTTTTPASPTITPAATTTPPAPTTTTPEVTTNVPTTHVQTTMMVSGESTTTEEMLVIG